MNTTYQRSFATAVAMLAALLISHAALAAEAVSPTHFHDTLLQQLHSEVVAQQERMTELAAALEGVAPADWTPTQTAEYLQEALWTVYSGLSLYNFEHARLPADLSSLAGSEYIPFNNGQPIRVLSVGDGFSPGDMTFQVCPPEFYSGARNPRPRSNELSIFGPTPEFAEFGRAVPNDLNTWAVEPHGAYFMLGQYAEIASVTAEKFRLLEQ